MVEHAECRSRSATNGRTIPRSMSTPALVKMIRPMSKTRCAVSLHTERLTLSSISGYHCQNVTKRPRPSSTHTLTPSSSSQTPFSMHTISQRGNPHVVMPKPPIAMHNPNIPSRREASSQEILSRSPPARRNRAAVIRHSAEDLKIRLEVLAEGHDARDVAAAVAIIWC